MVNFTQPPEIIKLDTNIEEIVMDLIKQNAIMLAMIRDNTSIIREYVTLSGKPMAIISSETVK